MKAAKTPGSKNGYAIVGKNCGRDKNGIFPLRMRKMQV